MNEEIFTGILDKNGKNINLGDILVRYCPNCNIGHWKGEVVWREDMKAFVFRNHKEKYDTDLVMTHEETSIQCPLEIIGNIKDNPELLNETI